MTGGSLSIGQLSQATGLKPHTIRYYERRGLLPKALRNESGYRRYSERDLRRLRLVLAAKSLGFTLGEIASIAAEKGSSLSSRLKPRLKTKSQELEGKLEHLRGVRRRVRTALAACGHGCLCTQAEKS